MLLRSSLRSPLHVVARINYFDPDVHGYESVCGQRFSAILELVLVPNQAEKKSVCLVCATTFKKQEEQ